MKYQDANLEVGIFENATYDNGKGKSIPVAGVAAVQELGSVKRNIPARSFFRTTAEEKRNPWRELFRDGVEASIHHGVEPAQVCLLYTSPSPRDRTRSRMPSSA